MKFALKDEVVKRHPDYAGRPYTSIPAQVVLDDIASRHPELERDALAHVLLPGILYGEQRYRLP
jgi:hypothetical protein